MRRDKTVKIASKSQIQRIIDKLQRQTPGAGRKVLNPHTIRLSINENTAWTESLRCF